jgi:8-oxo-dGTP diphosphatase
MKKSPINSPETPTPLRFAILATDIVLFTIFDGALYVRLMTVNRPPHFVHQPGLPGGLIRPDEIAEEAACRIIDEKGYINSKKVYLEQLFTFSNISRDPRGRVVAVGYIGLISEDKLTTKEKDSKGSTYWSPVHTAKHLAYDHDEILTTALKRLASRVHYTTLIGQLLPREFTLTELERAFESILGNDLDRRNFRKKILKLDIVKSTGKKRANGAFRPAELYRMTSKKVEEIEVL